MARPRAHNQNISQDLGLRKRCSDEWKKCSCPWELFHGSRKASAQRFWQEFKGERKVPTTFGEARDMAAVFRVAVDQGKWPLKKAKHVKDADITVSRALKIYRERPDVVEYSDSKGYYLALFEKEFGKHKLAEMAELTGEIKQWLQDLQKARGFKGKNFNEYLASISAFFSFTLTEFAKVITINPIAKIDRQSKADDRDVRITESQEKRLHLAGSPSFSRRLYAAFDLGMRRGEMLDTCVRHVDEENHTITLPALLTKGGKSTGKDQTFYVESERLWAVIEERLLTLSDPDARIFGNDDGSPISREEHEAEWHTAFEKAGLKPSEWLKRDKDGKPIGRRWHDIRHEFCYRIASNPNVTTENKMEAMRVRDLDTFKLYLPSDPTGVRAAFSTVKRFTKAVNQ